VKWHIVCHRPECAIRWAPISSTLDPTPSQSMNALARLIDARGPRSLIIVRFIVGAVFLSEGIQKFLFPIPSASGGSRRSDSVHRTSRRRSWGGSRSSAGWSRRAKRRGNEVGSPRPACSASSRNPILSALKRSDAVRAENGEVERGEREARRHDVRPPTG
jgi:hypothetical protein